MQHLNKANITKLKSLCKRYKPVDLYYKIREKLAAPYQDYNRNIEKYLPTAKELEDQIQQQAGFLKRPLVSIIVPTYETDEVFLRQMIDSCVAQTYPEWQLCIADGSHSAKVEKVIGEGYAAESRITYKRLKKNAGIAENTNQGFTMAEGDYIALLDHDDLLVPSALYEMVKRINETGADFLYSDEDKVSADLSQYMEPHFKLDFNRELLLGNNYICHFLMVSKEVLRITGGLDSRYDGAQDFDFVLRCSECAKRIEHIPKILYHWRIHSGSTAGNTDSKLYAYEAGKRAVEDYLKRKGWQGEVTMTNDLGFYRTRYQVPSDITVGIGLWGKASSKFEKVLAQVKEELKREQIKIVWEGEWESGSVNNNVGTQILKQKETAWEGEWKAEQQNKPEHAAVKCPDYMIILNRSVTNITKDGVLRLIGSCAREDVGMVGSRTICKGKVFQCGYRKEDDTFVPRCEGLPCHFKGYFRRAYLPVEVDAVSCDLTVMDRKAAGKRSVVEPAVEVDV